MFQSRNHSHTLLRSIELCVVTDLLEKFWNNCKAKTAVTGTQMSSLICLKYVAENSSKKSQ